MIKKIWKRIVAMFKRCPYCGCPIAQKTLFPGTVRCAKCGKAYEDKH